MLKFDYGNKEENMSCLYMAIHCNLDSKIQIRTKYNVMFQIQPGQCMTKEELIYVRNKFLHRYVDAVDEDHLGAANRDLKKFYRENIPSYRCDFVSLNKNKYPGVRKRSLEK